MKEVKYPNLVGEMARHGDTQRTIADLLSTSYNSIWRRLTGRTEWSISEIDKLCEYYHKNYDELFKKTI